MIPKESSVLVFFVNGKKVTEEHPDPEWTLLYYLRTKLRLCGTKLGCAEGGCGACTVMVSKYDRKNGQIKHLPVNACLAPVCSMHGLAVTTVEGIGSTKTKLHPVQERIAKAHGSQCGFCTPGIVMSMYTLLRSRPKPSMKDMEVAFQGNLCRCTGYRAIIEGYKTFTEEWELGHVANGLMNGSVNGNGSCPMGDQCCRNQKSTSKESDMLFEPSEFVPYDPSQEPIFPPELKLHDDLDREDLVFKGPNVTWYRPTTFRRLLSLKQQHPDAKIVVGNTEIGVEVKFKHFIYPVIIHPSYVPEMVQMDVTEKGLRIGASVTLIEMEHFLRKLITEQPESKTRIFKAIVDMLHYFAGKQIRSVAAVGGNIMTGSPISDLNPIFMACKIELELESECDGPRKVFFDENFFTGYRRNIVKNHEVLVAIHIPFTEERQYFHAFKQARRRDDDIAIVNSAVNVVFEPKSVIIKDIRMAFGGMAPITTVPINACKKLIGQPWNKETLDMSLDYLLEDMPLAPSAPGGMIQYRRSLTLCFFFRAFFKILKEVNGKSWKFRVDKRDLSALEGFHYQPPRSSQYYRISPKENKYDTINQPIVHASAFKQAAGEAIYCDDMSSMKDELYMGLVLSTKTYAKIKSIDPSEALASEKVHSFFSAKDIPKERNKIGPIFQDEEVFVSETVTSQGQIIGIVLAEDQISAQRAARKVKVEYEELQPIVVTIDDAIKHNSFYPFTRKMEKGNVDEVFKKAPHIIEGDCRTGAQEHFYLETQAVLAIPKKEDDELEIISSSQHPSELGKLVAEVLGVPQNRIVAKVKRMGGGFGGKESKSVILGAPAAFAAYKTNRPVRCMLDRDEDIITTGARHPFYIKYKVAFDDNGTILACEAHIYNNAGYSYDLSSAVLERAIFHIENAYKIPNARIFGFMCKTNLPSNTAFRGFGGPQGMFAAENMVNDIADYLGKDMAEVSQRNLYREGDTTHYNQVLENCTIRQCWTECLRKSNYHERRKEIDKYNRENRWKKRGLAIIPTKFGIAFSALFMNQAGALIHVYTDGSVLLTHGGTEMGQGLHTKMIQIASRVLEIPTSKIYISETSTDKVPNTSATAASSGSDLNGMAVLNACKVIKERLEPYKRKNPKGKWEDWVLAAYFDRVSLSSTGFYKTPDIHYDWETNTGMPFNYFTFGVGCSEVEIDCLTGDHQVLRTDIVMDLGESLNPAIDIGQVEGAFMQGYGLFVLEEMLYSPNGTIFTRGPGAYKLPGFADIPLEFNVSLLKGVSNPRAVYSSKAVGEPPLFLASSVFFAIKDAIGYARRDAGITKPFKLIAPATSARIRMACEDHITSKLKEPEPGSYIPWNVVP